MYTYTFWVLVWNKFKNLNSVYDTVQEEVTDGRMIKSHCILKRGKKLTVAKHNTIYVNFSRIWLSEPPNRMNSWLSNSTHPASGRIVCKRGYSLPLAVSVLWLYHHWNSATQLCVDSLHTTCSGQQQNLNKTSPSHYAEKQHSTPQNNPHRRQMLRIQHTYSYIQTYTHKTT